MAQKHDSHKTFKDLMDSCPHKGEQSYMTGDVIYHYEGARRVPCAEFKKHQDQSSRHHLTNDKNSVILKTRTGKELACFAICQFGTGSDMCTCKNENKNICASVEDLYDKVIELSLKD